MKMNNFFLVIFLAFLASCTSSPKNKKAETIELFKYLRSISYEPIVPPSTIMEPGSVIAYVSGLEQIQAARSSCAAERIPQRYSQTMLLDQKYESDIGASVDFVLNNLLQGKLDLSAAASAGKVKKVELSFKQPFIWSVDRLTIERYIKASPDDCVEKAVAKGNVIVHDVIGAKGFNLTFYTDSGTKISAEAEIKSLVKASPGAHYSVSNSGTVSVEGDLFFGYRILEGFVGPGASDVSRRDSFYVSEVETPSKAGELRKSSN